jgi:hypothetical protein
MSYDPKEKPPRVKPKPGIHNAVCSKIFETGKHPDQNGAMKDRLRVVFELDQKMEDGKPFLFTSKQYTKSLHEKASFRKDVEAWLGKSFPKDEPFEFNEKSLIGKKCTLILVENGEYINFSAIAPAQDSNNVEITLPADWCPEWIKKEMKEGGVSDFKDDIPF